MTVGRRPTSAVFTLDGREAWVVSAGSDAASSSSKPQLGRVTIVETRTRRVVAA